MPVRLGSIEEYMFQHLPEIQDKIFVMTAESTKTLKPAANLSI